VHFVLARPPRGGFVIAKGIHMAAKKKAAKKKTTKKKGKKRK